MNDLWGIDLFAGSGGLSEGFTNAGYRFIAHIEKNKDAIETLRTRKIYHFLKTKNMLNIYNSYLNSEISREEILVYISANSLNLFDSLIHEEINYNTLQSLYQSIKKKMGERDIEKIDFIIGGPPCQSYSIVGRNRDPNNMKNDSRNKLYELFISFVREFEPRFLVFENVIGIKSASGGQFLEDFITKITEIGYYCKEKILNAADFLVLQNRKRLFVIGSKNENEFNNLEFQKFTHSYKIKDILDDLPPIYARKYKRKRRYISEPSKYLTETGIREKENILTNHISRIPNENDKRIYRKVIEVWEKENRRLKYTELKKDLQKHKNNSSFLDRFKIVGADEQHSQTVVAHLSKDGHYFIHPERKQSRSISIREAARLQSFPDNYFFEGSMTSCYRQIGNAVPPLLSFEIAKKIYDTMETNNNGHSKETSKDR